jgi:hypothetical protein
MINKIVEGTKPSRKFGFTDFIPVKGMEYHQNRNPGRPFLKKDGEDKFIDGLTEPLYACFHPIALYIPFAVSVVALAYYFSQ